jgi:predicted nucleic acid-binding protein
MYLLDTNVVSELRKKSSGKADPNVVAWEAGIPSSSASISVVTVLELELGTLRISRRDSVQGAVLRSWIDNSVLPAFAGRILPIDLEIARRSAALHIPDPRPEHDALIAATALVHNMTVVTRNTADFAPTGVPTLNPWQASPNP